MKGFAITGDSHPNHVLSCKRWHFCHTCPYKSAHVDPKQAGLLGELKIQLIINNVVVLRHMVCFYCVLQICNRLSKLIIMMFHAEY